MSKNENTSGMPRIGGGHGGSQRFLRPASKPKDTKKTIRRLLTFFAGQYKLLLFSFFLIFVSSIISLITPYLIGKAVDLILIKKEKMIILVLLGLFILDGLLRFFRGYILTTVSQKMVRLIRESFFKILQKLPIAFFDAYPHGELMSRITNDTDNIAGILATAITQFMSVVIVLTGSIAMMLYLSPLMTFCTLVTVPLVYLLTKTISKKTRKFFKEQQDTLGKLNGIIEEDISGIKIVKAYGHEKESIENFEQTNERLRSVSTKAQVWSGFVMPIMNVINNFGFVVVAGVGGYLAVKGTVSVGTIASFINYSKQFGMPLNDLANTFNTLQSALASAERVFEILDAEEEAKDTAHATALITPKGDIIFENVFFGYTKDANILKNVSFDVKAGEAIALVGPTGAGKTTIVNLITRFYDVTSGTISIDGKDIRNYTRDSLRKCFGIVLQDTYLFSGTIFDNIKYGRLEATENEVFEAAKASGADKFIKKLSEGYNTLLSESGQNLSQGQRQLLAISRAILSNPSILILDEATSSVDTRTELGIQKAMTKLMKGRTSFIIAHRLSTIVSSDKILVISNGELAEVGNHTELMAQGGIYKQMNEV